MYIMLNNILGAKKHHHHHHYDDYRPPPPPQKKGFQHWKAVIIGVILIVLAYFGVKLVLGVIKGATSWIPSWLFVGSKYPYINYNW